MAGTSGTQKKLELIALTRYDDLKGFTAHGVTKDEWKDSELVFKGALPLKRYSERECAETVLEVLNGVTKSMTEVIAYKILNLTWNLRSENDPTKFLFLKATSIPVNGDLNSLSTLESLPTGTATPYIVPTDDKDLPEWNRQGCFYAASMLKLFAKEGSSWSKAQEHIAEQYKKFTNKPFTIHPLGITDPCVDTLRRLFQTKLIYRWTLGHILYGLYDLKEGRGMTMMLFEQHLSYTGMHIVGLFSKAVICLRAHPSDLRRALHTPSIEPVLDQLMIILKKYKGSTEPDRIRETYKFSRIYDPQMFSHLQTRNCNDVVCILGHICNLCGNAGTGDVMKIAAVAIMSPAAREKCGMVAANIFNYFKVDLKN